jgi:hypothetical protein
MFWKAKKTTQEHNLNMRNPYADFVWFFGTAEDTSSDPLRLGRIRVRATGFHPSSDVLSPQQLPYALVLNGGAARINPGQMVFGFFLDGEEAQQPCVMGVVGSAIISAQVFNEAVKAPETKTESKSIWTRGADAIVDLFTPEPSTPTPPRSAIKGGVYVGDSIAVGIGTAAKQTIQATVGMNSTNILKNYSGKSGSSYTVISAGTNDQQANYPTESNLRKLRASINSPKVIFIVPYTKQQNSKPSAAVIANMQKAATAVRKVAAEKGDTIIELDNYKTNDGLHPSNYSTVAKDIEKIVGQSS